MSKRYTMIEPAARLLHVVEGAISREDTDLEITSVFRPVEFALCGRETKGFDILHPLGDRFRYQSIIGECIPCLGCDVAEKHTPATGETP